MTDKAFQKALRKALQEGAIMGLGEAADVLGVSNSNIKDIKDFPEHVTKLQTGRVWLASDIEEFVPVWKARREARQTRRDRAA